MTMTLALLLALAAPPTMPPDSGSIHGEVRSAMTDAPLAGATVQLVGAAGRGAVTDSTGLYRLRGLPAGAHRLRVSRPGHEPLEVEVRVPGNGEVTLDLSLRIRPVVVAGVHARAVPHERTGERDGRSTPSPDLELATGRSLGGTPGIAELGPGGGSGSPPGTEPIDPADVLYVRGGVAERKLLLLDGAPVYTPFHLGGLLELFETDALSSSTLYLGGAPARYDGGLSYILDLNTRAGREGAHTSGAADLMSARLLTEGSAGGRIRYLAAGRAVHGLGMAPFMEQDALPYDFMDGLARVDLRVGREGALSVTGFGNREAVRLDSAAVGGDGARWRNRALSARYAGRLGGTEATITVATSGFAAALPVVNDSVYPAGGATDRVRAAVDLARDAGPVRLRYGGSLDRMVLRHETGISAGEALGHAFSLSSIGTVRGGSGGAYLDASWQAAPSLLLRGGLRGDIFSADAVPRLAPRLSATWLLTERAALTAAAGRYHQHVRAPAFARGIEEGRSAGTFAGPALSVGGATHTTLTLDQELDPGLRLGVEGFFKSFEVGSVPDAERSHTSGVDLWVQRETGRLRGWAGYSLAWVWSRPGGQSTTDLFAGRQLLSAGGTAALGTWGELDAKFVYGAGLPWGSIPLVVSTTPDGVDRERGTRVLAATSGADETPPLPTPPDDPYLRLDLGLSSTFTPEWGGRTWQISPYAKVLNALDRRQGMFYRRAPGDDGDARPLATLPVLPVVGVEWRF